VSDSGQPDLKLRDADRVATLKLLHVEAHLKGQAFEDVSNEVQRRNLKVKAAGRDPVTGRPFMKGVRLDRRDEKKEARGRGRGRPSRPSVFQVGGE
jgi:hypothetical protein